MNLTLGTLAELKTQLLNEGLRDQTTYDSALIALGKGVAARFEKYCNREFLRTVGYVETFEADRTKHVVRRYPLETITEVAVKQVRTDDWAILTDLIVNTIDEAGLVYFYGQQGWQRGLVRLTYTGGYWFDDSADQSGELPAGAAARPDDLFLAWLLQCEWIWANRDKLGVSLGEPAESAKYRSLASATLIPEVEATLKNYVRYQMS